jgi:hydroxymethylbilane synthase
VRTRGDRDQRTSALARGDGVFVAALEQALLERRIDLAVHSLKDMPTGLPAALEIVAVLPRHDARDAVVGRPLGELAPGARVGTASPRRAAFVHALRPDLEVVAVRGNVPRRVARVAAGEVDAVVLALAGLERLGMAAEVVEILPLDTFPPAPGQGAIAVEARAGEAPPGLQSLDDAASRRTTTAERLLLARLGASCELPFGAFAEVLPDGRLHLTAQLVGADGRLRTADLSGALDGEVVAAAAATLGAA